jgi:hypothetical protein
MSNLAEVTNALNKKDAEKTAVNKEIRSIEVCAVVLK